MKKLVDYQSIWTLADKEYIYLLESYYFHDNDRFEKILHHKGYCVVIIPDNPPYGLYFKDGKRITKLEWDKFIEDHCKTLPPAF